MFMAAGQYFIIEHNQRGSKLVVFFVIQRLAINQSKTETPRWRLGNYSLDQSYY